MNIIKTYLNYFICMPIAQFAACTKSFCHRVIHSVIKSTLIKLSFLIKT